MTLRLKRNIPDSLRYRNFSTSISDLKRQFNFMSLGVRLHAQHVILHRDILGDTLGLFSTDLLGIFRDILGDTLGLFSTDLL